MRLISSEGFSPKDQLVLKSMVDLLSYRTNDTWKYVEESPCDVVLIDVDNLEDPAGVAVAIESRNALAIEYSSKTTTQSARHRVQKPLRAAALISLLNLVGMRQGTASPAVHKGAAKPASPDSDSQPESPAEVAFLDTLASENPPWLKISTNEAECIVDMVNERYHMKGAHLLHDLLLAPDKTLSVSQDELCPTGHGSGWIGMPHLKWRFGITLSGDELCTDLRERPRFKLLRWPPPEIGRTYPGAMTLCALLSRKAGASLEEIQASSGISAGEAIGFINGAHLCGALSDKVPDAPNATPAPPPKTQNSGLFALIRDRLSKKTK